MTRSNFERKEEGEEILRKREAAEQITRNGCCGSCISRQYTKLVKEFRGRRKRY